MTGVGTGFVEGSVVPFTPAALVSFEGGTEATASGAAEPPTSTVGLAVASTGAAPASAAVGKSVVITVLDFPLSIHGVISGSLIVFILSIGFFITPALMGGPADVMIAMLIERSVEITFDWAAAAVMSLLLLVATLVLYSIYYRLTDVRRMMGA